VEALLERLSVLKGKMDRNICDEIRHFQSYEKRIDTLKKYYGDATPKAVNASLPPPFSLSEESSSCTKDFSERGNDMKRSESSTPFSPCDNNNSRKRPKTKSQSRGDLDPSVERRSFEKPSDLQTACIQAEQEFWKSHQINRMICEHLLRSGCIASAKALADECRLADFVDIDLFEQAFEVSHSLREKRCSVALRWCAENGPKLRRTGSPLEFRLRLKEFVELVRDEKRLEAVMSAPYTSHLYFSF
jgi:hypothetical protein